MNYKDLTWFDLPNKLKQVFSYFEKKIDDIPQGGSSVLPVLTELPQPDASKAGKQFWLNGTLWTYAQGGQFGTITEGTPFPVVVKNSAIRAIHMQPGEYLMDIINEINERDDATSDNPYTIYFYNHSKTIDWDRWTQLIPFPEHVYLEFVGDINWWVNVPNYYPQMGFDEGLITPDSIDRLFLGFTFSRANENGRIIKTGLPNFIGAAYFSGLDDFYEIASTIADLPNFGNGTLGIVFCEEDKNLYKKVGDNFVIITQSFENTNLSSYNFHAGYLAFANLQSANLQQANLQSANLQQANLQGADLFQANLQGADLFQANLQSANLLEANLQSANLLQANLQNAFLANANLQNAFLANANLQNANLSNIQVNNSTRFQGANLTGATNLPADMDTKSLFIAKVGANNVNAQTIWIDGTSILS